MVNSEPCQIKLVETPREKAYLHYIEDVSNNRPGGLKGSKTTPKEVIHHENTAHLERCFVRLFKQYTQLLPRTDAFYLQPLKKQHLLAGTQTSQLVTIHSEPLCLDSVRKQA